MKKSSEVKMKRSDYYKILGCLVGAGEIELAQAFKASLQKAHAEEINPAILGDIKVALKKYSRIINTASADLSRMADRLEDKYSDKDTIVGAKPPKLGTVYPIKARLYDSNKKEIGYCIDTPNAIAKAFMEWPKAMYVKPFMEKLRPRAMYKDRMNKWNEAKSGLVKTPAKK